MLFVDFKTLAEASPAQTWVCVDGGCLFVYDRRRRGDASPLEWVHNVHATVKYAHPQASLASWGAGIAQLILPNHDHANETALRLAASIDAQ